VMADQFPDRFYPGMRKILNSVEQMEEAARDPEIDDGTEERWYQRPMYPLFVWRMQAKRPEASDRDAALGEDRAG